MYWMAIVIGCKKNEWKWKYWEKYFWSHYFWICILRKILFESWSHYFWIYLPIPSHLKCEFKNDKIVIQNICISLNFWLVTLCDWNLACSRDCLIGNFNGNIWDEKNVNIFFFFFFFFVLLKRNFHLRWSIF